MKFIDAVFQHQMNAEYVAFFKRYLPQEAHVMCPNKEWTCHNLAMLGHWMYFPQLKKFLSSSRTLDSFGYGSFSKRQFAKEKSGNELSFEMKVGKNQKLGHSAKCFQMVPYNFSY